MLLENYFEIFGGAQCEVAVAISTYNHQRPDGSVYNLTLAMAHYADRYHQCLESYGGIGKTLIFFR